MDRPCWVVSGKRVVVSGSDKKSRSEQFMPRLELLVGMSISCCMWEKEEGRGTREEGRGDLVGREGLREWAEWAVSLLAANRAGKMIRTKATGVIPGNKARWDFCDACLEIRSDQRVWRIG